MAPFASLQHGGTSIVLPEALLQVTRRPQAVLPSTMRTLGNAYLYHASTLGNLVPVICHPASVSSIPRNGSS